MAHARNAIPCCEPVVYPDVDRAHAVRMAEVAFGAGLYADGERDTLPEPALLASLGCGNPTAMVDLSPDGLDMTDEMLDLARANQAKAGIANVHWLKGHIEAIPLPTDTVDVVLSNCVINLSTHLLREAARVLKPGGRFAVSDVVADAGMDEATRADVAQYVGCIAGALTHDEYSRYLADAGLTDIEITETHRVHTHAGSAIIRPQARSLTLIPTCVRLLK